MKNKITFERDGVELSLSYNDLPTYNQLQKLLQVMENEVERLRTQK